MNAADAVAEALPDRSVRRVDPVQRGNHKRTYLVTLDDGEVVVQLSTRPAAFRTELALARAVRERTSVPTPAILAEESYEGGRYAVVERASGDDLHERFAGLPLPTRETVARSFGRWLAACHEAFRFDGYGDVRLTDGELRATDADWRAWFGEHLDAGLAALPPSLSDLREPVETALADADLPERPPARLYPWDFRPGNAVYDDDHGVTAVLDWGEPLAADPALSVAKADHLICAWYGDAEPLRAAFRDGYAAERPLPSVPRLYRLAAVVRSAVDSNGEVTRPGYPERTGSAAVDFHRDRLAALLAGAADGF
ncbi:phosphotransferase family protein [Halosegnis longus]|uniref:phosphotransferase family protein n=1 Tax=Halosegnis longus TaxID=2216012 RepID=UPI00129D2C20|nr:aminoglycoside phosphotransferase family protein [Halosegnis longus]